MRASIALIFVSGLLGLSSAFADNISITVNGNPHPNTISLGVELYHNGNFVDKQETSNGSTSLNSGSQADNYPVNLDVIVGNPLGNYLVQIQPDSTCSPILTENCESSFSALPYCAVMNWDFANKKPIPSSLSFSFTYTGSNQNVLHFSLSCYAQ